MCALTIQCLQGSGARDWLEETLRSIERESVSLSFCEISPCLYSVVAVYLELVPVMEIVGGRRDVFVVDIESGWGELP